MFTFSGDPGLVRAVRDAWPGASESVAEILDTLETTLEINRMWVQGRGFESNQLRARNLRSNLLRHWRTAMAPGDSAPRVMVKLGASHVIRGRNSNGVFDIGSLAPELAEMADGRVISMLVLPGEDSKTAVLDPSKWTYEARPAKDGYARGIGSITGAAYPDAFTLIDLRPLRAVVGTREKTFGSRVLQIVHGFDLLLVMSGSTASSQLELPGR